MSEWLDLMLAEIARKKEEEKTALEEAARRETANAEAKSPRP
jgi:vacuolar-type H+-ATPase subunit E/Vma4